MQTRVSDIYDSTREHYRIRLQAGKAGLSNTIAWVYLAEDFQNMSFLKGGEFVITTGLFTTSGVTPEEFVRALILRNCGALLINVGKYIPTEGISDALIALCEENGLPLFTMPWEIHLIDVMQDMSTLLLQKNRLEDRLNVALQSALYQSPVQDTILRTIDEYGFPTDGVYRLFTIRNLRDITRVTSPMNALGIHFHLFSHDNYQLLLLGPGTTPERSLEEIIDTICFFDGIEVGVSDRHANLKDLGEMYSRARFALAVSAVRHSQYAVFDELGIFQILFCAEDGDLLKRIADAALGPLDDYDAEHKAGYLDTLSAYLSSDCNLIRTAEATHTHRNTVVYRIRKTEEILGYRLDNAEVKFNLRMALYIREYREI